MISNTPNIILELINVEKSYIVDRPVLKNINFTVEEGDIIAITGDNGAGKSSLLKIIAGLDSNHQGIVKYRGKTYIKPSTNIILLHQSYEQLFPWLTVEQNIIQLLKAVKKMNYDQIISITHSALKNVGIEKELYSRYPHQLSGGQKQRVALARALAFDADVLLMDEPFSAIDETSRSSFHELLKSLVYKTKKTILLVSHTTVEINTLTNKIIHLDNHTT